MFGDLDTLDSDVKEEFLGFLEAERILKSINRGKEREERDYGKLEAIRSPKRFWDVGKDDRYPKWSDDDKWATELPNLESQKPDT